MNCSPILALLALCTPAPEGPPKALSLVDEAPAATCMTKEQARSAFATSHLYWHGPRHCWNNSPGRASKPTLVSAPSKPRSKPVSFSVADANGNVVREARIEIYYPTLLRAQADVASDLYAMQRPITNWPLMLDIDVTGPNPDKGIDGCCWPPLEDLK